MTLKGNYGLCIWTLIKISIDRLETHYRSNMMHLNGIQTENLKNLNRFETVSVMNEFVNTRKMVHLPA
jgi:hypothetical protein